MMNSKGQSTSKKSQCKMSRVTATGSGVQGKRLQKKVIITAGRKINEKSEVKSTGESPANSAIIISLVAHEILGRVNFVDLKSVRLVNKIWNTAACNELFQRNSSRILSFHVGYDSLKNNIELKKLNQLLKAREFIFPSTPQVNNNFPCTRFKINGLLESPHVQKLFNLHGQGIKVLELNFPSDRYAKPRRHNLKVFQLIPNIVELYLDASDLPYHLSDELKFSSLLIFNGGHYPSDASDEARSSLAFKILAGSPNLKQVQKIKFNHVEFFIMAGKVHLITELHMTISSEQDLNKIEKLANAQPKLERMSIKYWQKQDSADRNLKISNDLTKILMSSQNTLEELWMTPFLGNFENEIIIPQLNNLKKLKLYGTATRVKDENDGKFRRIQLTPTRILPLGLNPNLTFPILRMVTLVSMDYSFDVMNQFFPPNESPKFVGVDHLEIYVQKREPLSSAVFDRFREWFPNLRGIKLTGCPTLQNWIDIFRIWEGPQLEQLEVELPVGYIKQFTLDTVLTGIAGDVCERLRHSKNIETNVANLRTRPSIVNLNGLKCFNIIKRHHQTKKILMSKVTKLYAFDLMPMLQYNGSYK